MPARSRVIHGPLISCQYFDTLTGRVHTKTHGPLEGHQCDDTVEIPRRTDLDHLLYIAHDVLECGHVPIERANTRYRNVTGTCIPTGLGRLYSHHIVENQLGPMPLASTGLARSNPSRPKVDLPVFLSELRDLPRLIQVAGTSIVKRRPDGGVRFNPETLKRFKAKPLTTVSGLNLNYHFGWSPLIEDVLKLVDFGEHVDHKVAQLRKLHSGKGLKRRVKYQQVSYELPEVVSNSLETGVCQLDSYRKQRGTRDAWLTVRWKPTSPPPIDDAAYRWAAIRAVLGLDLTMSTIWEMIPFSWLVDWFSNVGDVLMSHRNTIPATPTRVLLMWTDEEVVSWRYKSGTPSVAPYWPGARRTRTRLNRVFGGATMAGYLPFLDGRQLSILGSLSVLQADAWQRRR